MDLARDDEGSGAKGVEWQRSESDRPAAYHVHIVKDVDGLK